MPRPATGSVLATRTTRGTSYALRFTAYGERRYQTLGSSEEGWTRARADEELQNVLADVRRGIWRPPAPAAAIMVEPDPTFHEFASDWFTAHRGEWAPNTVLDYEWQLRNHLLPFFAEHRLSQISIAEVDRYRQYKVDDGALSAESINKTITRLGQILEVALERELIMRNPVRVNPRKRKLKAAKARPVHLDGTDQIVALLDAARELDAVPKSATRSYETSISLAAGSKSGDRRRPRASGRSTSCPCCTTSSPSTGRTIVGASTTCSSRRRAVGGATRTTSTSAWSSPCSSAPTSCSPTAISILSRVA
jgi:integrase-like protein